MISLMDVIAWIKTNASSSMDPEVLLTDSASNKISEVQNWRFSRH